MKVARKTVERAHKLGKNVYLNEYNQLVSVSVKN